MLFSQTLFAYLITFTAWKMLLHAFPAEQEIWPVCYVCIISRWRLCFVIFSFPLTLLAFRMGIRANRLRYTCERKQKSLGTEWFEWPDAMQWEDVILFVDTSVIIEQSLETKPAGLEWARKWLLWGSQFGYEVCVCLCECVCVYVCIWRKGVLLPIVVSFIGSWPQEAKEFPKRLFPGFWLCPTAFASHPLHDVQLFLHIVCSFAATNSTRLPPNRRLCFLTKKEKVFLPPCNPHPSSSSEQPVNSHSYILSPIVNGCCSDKSILSLFKFSLTHMSGFCTINYSERERRIVWLERHPLKRMSPSMEKC